jgi:formylmethanofuran dehydrogenase subunit E
MLSHLSTLLKKSSAKHSHLCPRQVLGVRMGLAGLAALGLKAPVTTRTGLVFIETDGCFADGIQVATGATIGHRTLRVHDLGKIAAAFTNLKTGNSLRLTPQLDVRSRALKYAPYEKRRYYAQLQGYQEMPDEELFTYKPVELQNPPVKIISHPNKRAHCSACGEEIINEREILLDGNVLCYTCAHGGYYRLK